MDDSDPGPSWGVPVTERPPIVTAAHTDRREIPAMETERRTRSAVGRLVVGATVVAILASAGIEVLGAQTRDSNSVQLRLESVAAEVNRHSSLEWQAVADGGITDELWEAVLVSDQAIERGTGLLATAASTDPAVAEFIGVVGRFRAAVAVMLDLLRSGDIEGATEADETTVDPLFEVVHSSAERLLAAYAARADLTSTVSRVGTIVLLALAAGAIAILARRATRREAEDRIEARFRALVQNSSDLVAVVDGNGTITYVGPSLDRLLGRSSVDWLGRPYRSLVHDEDLPALADLITDARSGQQLNTRAALLRMAHADGTWRPFETIARSLERDPDVEGLVLTARDAAERERLAERLRFQATHDQLTGLANRNTFLDAIEGCRRRSEPIEVLFLDIDDFKGLNDNLGHTAGDRILATIGTRLRGAIRPTDLAARLGGDEFGVLVTGADSETSSRIVGQRILDAINVPIEVRGGEAFRLSASIGVTRGRSATSSEDLVSEADLAMYEAKRAGKNRIAVFEPSLLAASRERLSLLQELREAIGAGEFLLHYQPILDLRTGAIDELEALVRWQHPKRGLLPPHAFIPLAEEAGLIDEIGDWVLREAVAVAARISRPHPGPALRMSVNVSALQLQNVGFGNRVAGLLADSGLPAPCLTVEITESVFAGPSPALTANLERLRAIGVRIVIDDFGTGYSSLSYLRRLAVDAIKIDRSFVSAQPERGVDVSLCRAIVSVAQALGLTTVAEGIETQEQLAQMRAIGCDLGQGYEISRPLPPDMVEAFLDTHRIGRESLLAAAPEPVTAA